jgi:DNA (cytosine-5)-methyltransferase 1
MGYKLAGFNVLGANEIDPRMADLYVRNHHPKYMYVEPIQTFKLRNDLPPELYNLDILDGSPPCSSFSMAGSRERQWGVEKVFREGQAKQVLDTLFFDFIDLARKLQPKVVIAENVKGMLHGRAMEYVHRVLAEFESAGYAVNYKVLNAQDLGVPQHRQRVFFYAIRKDLVYPREGFGTKPLLELGMKQKPIMFENLYIPGRNDQQPMKHQVIYGYWKKRKRTDGSFGDITLRINGKASGYTRALIHKDRVAPCMVACGLEVLYDEFRHMNRSEACCAGTFPQDYDFGKQPYLYVIGMSVPPFMTRYMADEMYKQVLSKNKHLGWPKAIQAIGTAAERALVWIRRKPKWLNRPVNWAR